MSAASFPLSIEIGATLSSSVGAALRSTEAQLGRIGEVMGRLENASLGASRLETLRQQAAEAGRAWRAQQAEIEKLQAAKASGQWTTKGLTSARARVAALEERVNDPNLSAARRAKATDALAKARSRLAEQEAKAEERYSRQLDRLIAQAGRAKDAFDRIKAAIAQEASQLERSGIQTTRLAAEKVKLGQALDLLKTRTKALARAQTAHQAVLDKRNAYRQQIADAVALGGALYGLTRSAIAFEEAIVGIRRVSNFDDAEYTRLGDAILKLSTRLPLAANELANISAQGARVGLAGEALDRFTESAGRMAVAWGLSGEEAGKELSAVQDAFGLTQLQAEQSMDAINHLSNQMRAEAGDLLRILSKSGPSAQVFGLNAQQVTALGAAFLHMKAEPKQAATAIDSLLKKLGSADKQGKEFQDALFRIGISAEVFAEMVKRDPQQALLTFLELVKQSPEGMPLLTDLFGEGQADDIARLIQGLDHYKAALDQVSDAQRYAGSLTDEYDTIAKSTANSLQLLKNQATRLMVTIGSALLPGLNALVGAVSGPIESVADLARQFPLLTQVVVGATAGLMALKVAGMGLGYAWTFVRGGATMAWMGVERVRAALALARVEAIKAPVVLNTVTSSFWRMLPAIGATTAALLANPITWVVAGIGAAVAGLALVIRKYWEPLSAWIGGFWDGIKEGVAPAIEGIGQALAPLAPIGSAIAAAFSVVGDAVSGVVGWMSELLAPVSLAQDEFEGLASSGKSVGMTVGQTLGAAFHALTLPLQVVAMLVDLVGSGIQKLGQTADWVSDKVGKLTEIGSSIAGFFGIKSEPPAAPVAAAMPAITPQPVSRQVSIENTLSAPITINAPAGSDAREIARLVDERLRLALRDQARRTGALYD